MIFAACRKQTDLASSLITYAPRGLSDKRRFGGCASAFRSRNAALLGEDTAHATAKPIFFRSATRVRSINDRYVFTGTLSKFPR